MECDGFAMVGHLVVSLLLLSLLHKLCRAIWSCWLGSWLGFGYSFEHAPDAFAVVTGATDGLGLEYARFFARKGYRLLLVSRSADKLDSVRRAIEADIKQCPEVRVHAADLSRADVFDGLQRAVEQLPRVEVLVNNVGCSYPYAEYLTQLPDAWRTIDDIINVNVACCTRLLHVVLAVMEVQRKGLVLNLSSFSASYPTPLLAVYGASKTYVDFLSRALQLEYARKNIVIQSVLPAYVVSKMSKIRRPSLMVPTASDYVAAQTRTIGFEHRTYGYWPHKLQGFMLDVVLASVGGPRLNSLISFNSLKSVRARAHKKYNVQAKQQ